MCRYLLIAFLFFGCEADTTSPVEQDTMLSADTAADTVPQTDTVSVDTSSFVDTMPVKTDECAPATAEDDCDDGILCTLDRCYGGACINVANNIPCDDGDPCTYDSCDPDQITNGGCSNKPRSCGDSDICTVDVCIPGIGCDNSQQNIDACTAAMDECHGAICVPGGGGCQLVPVSCEDGDITTVDMCVPGIGCTHSVVECGSGSFGDCQPSNPCMVAQCIAGHCEETLKNCDDSVTCTDDSCDSNGFCQHVANAGNCPNDTLTCTVAMCDVKYGCVQSQVQCDDDNICTADSCVEGGGCRNELIDGCCMTSDQCDDGDACTTDICNPLNRCEHPPLNPDDGIACTLDTCVQDGTSSHYYHNPKDSLCPEGLYCSADAGCVECTSYSHCGDGNFCTEDSCNWQTHMCEYDPRVCGENQQCNSDTGACEDTSDGCQSGWQCEDGDPCTDDLCREDGQCAHIIDPVCIHCDPEAAETGCPTSTVCDGLKTVVNYNGNCSLQGQCEFISNYCYNNICEERFCQEGVGCRSTSKCDDGIACTNDYCNYSDGECTNTPIDGCVE